MSSQAFATRQFLTSAGSKPPEPSKSTLPLRMLRCLPSNALSTSLASLSLAVTTISTSTQFAMRFVFW